MTKVTLKRFKKLVEAYGSNPKAWPAFERVEAEKFILENDAANEIINLAGTLDAALDVLPTPENADVTFIKRLETIPFAAKAAAIGKEAMPATFQEFLGTLFPAKSLVPQGAGLAIAGVLGIWLGFSSAGQAEDNIVHLDAGQYLFENPDLNDDLENFQ
jgi:hypothetical protein